MSHFHCTFGSCILPGDSKALLLLNPEAIVKAGNTDLMAEDVVGRLDVTTTFLGQELNIEYLFGLFYNIRDDTSTGIIGYPKSHTITSLIIEPPVAYYSAVVELEYATINRTISIQADFITAWNDDLKMISWDATLRRWSQGFRYIISQIAPQIAKELGETYDPATTNTSAIMAQKAATELCATAMQYCTGDNQQYESCDQCYAVLTEEKPWGDPLDGGLDTTWCRYIHRNMVPFRPRVHRAHIGPSGGDMCIDRDYLEVTYDYPFSQTLVAPNVSYNAQDTGSLSEKSISELAKAQLTLNFPTTVAFYPIPVFVFTFILYFSAKVSHWGFKRYSAEYNKMSPANQRNTVTYVLNAFYTTVALICQCMATPALAHSYSQVGIKNITITAVIISALYLFELVYRDFMRPSLFAHHFCTLLAIFSLFVTIEKSFHPATVTVGVIWLFQATTEQSIFIRLLLYRLRYNPRIVRITLRFAANQSFFVKFVFAIYLLVEHSLKLVHFTSTPTDVYFSVVVYVVGILLLTTQVYGSWAVWAISLKLKTRDGASSSSSPSGSSSIRGDRSPEIKVDLQQLPFMQQNRQDDDLELDLKEPVEA
ncbi:hypothetical protein JCM11641_001355 [Rhodosporidiobolus odoratus]